MTDEELRQFALSYGAEHIRSSISALDVLDDLTPQNRADLAGLLNQLADELEEMGRKKPRSRRQAVPKEDPPFSLQVTRTDGGGEHPSRYKTFSRAKAAAIRLIETENADRTHRNPTQRVWVFEGGAVRVCYTVDNQGRAVIDKEAHRNIGVEVPQE